MQLSPQITFRNMATSKKLTELITEKTDKLTRIFAQIQRCEVVVEAPHRRHTKGTHFHVRIHLTMPGGDIVAGRDPSDASSHEDPHNAVRDAFDAARRQLQSHTERHDKR